MSEGPPTCPRCSAPLAPTAAQGALCPRCLLEQGLAHSDPLPPPPPPELAELAPLFPELEIVELLGQGGMGAVYKARQRALGRWVALKILTPRPGHESGFEARFEREAHALARLAHPNVVGIHDSGRTQGRCWLLMEYVEGASLRQLLRTGELDVPRALAIVRQVCDALEFAHEQGVVHRDIKPENVLVDTRGRVKIADFGLAKIVGEPGAAEPITRTQQSLGTPQYMAPEQLTGSPNVDHRADIYSLGVVFYELLTGELPLGRFEPPSQRVHVDVRLDEVVLRALERAPERRYQKATELKTGIERLDQPGASADPPWMFALFSLPVVYTILGLALDALGAGAQAHRTAEQGGGMVILGMLCGLAWATRADRRGALLRYGLGLTAAGALVVGIVRAPELVAQFELNPRPAEWWIARVLFAFCALEALRFAWGGRRALAARLVDRNALGTVDGGLLAGFTWLVWRAILAPAMDFAPLLAAILTVADGFACRRASRGPEPREWVREHAPAPPADSRPRRWLLGILAPVLVAASAWVMQAYTREWGWYGIAASSLVLALAVAGYLQQALPGELAAELRAQGALLRSSRALMAIVVLAVGAMGLGAALLHERSPLKPAGEPDLAHVVHLAQLVEANSREGIDPLAHLSERVAAAHLTSRQLAADAPEPEHAPSPGGGEGLLLILLAPAVLVWTSRWGTSWAGCWRYSAEVLLIVIVGLCGSLPLRALVPARGAGADPNPLTIEASFPFGDRTALERLSAALVAEGYSFHERASRRYGTEGEDLLVVASLEALRPPRQGERDGRLEIELAGDAGHWASAVRVTAADLPAPSRPETRERVMRILRETRSP